jgi:hypothetical protein
MFHVGLFFKKLEKQAQSGFAGRFRMVMKRKKIAPGSNKL